MRSRAVHVGRGTADSGIDSELIARAADALRAGQVVAIPTDTVYGLAAAIDQPRAIERLYAIKGRPDEKAIPILISDVDHLQRLSPQLSVTELRLARAFWPGALTLVLQGRSDLPRKVTNVTGDGVRTVAVRMPDNGIARAIIAAAGGALAVTSANRSGEAPAVEADEVHRFELCEHLLVIDGGRAPGGVPSTIIRTTGEHAEILREGAISASAIAAALAESEADSGDDDWARYDLRMTERERIHTPKATR